MKIELDLPANVVKRLAKGGWVFSTGWGVMPTAALVRAEAELKAAVAEAVAREES